MLTLVLAVCSMLFTREQHWNHVKQAVTCCTMHFVWVPILLCWLITGSATVCIYEKKITDTFCPHVLTRLRKRRGNEKGKNKLSKWNFKWWHFPWGVALNLYSLLAHSPNKPQQRLTSLSWMRWSLKGRVLLFLHDKFLPSFTNG